MQKMLAKGRAEGYDVPRNDDHKERIMQTVDILNSAFVTVSASLAEIHASYEQACDEVQRIALHTDAVEKGLSIFACARKMDADRKTFRAVAAKVQTTLTETLPLLVDMLQTVLVRVAAAAAVAEQLGEAPQPVSEAPAVTTPAP
jgi:hypothetical protein